jgi:hypothetical protein
LVGDVDAEFGHGFDGGGLMVSAGALPAERTSILSPARWVRNPAAIWERPALWTQTNRTLGLEAMEDNTFR